jgi:hypothetical protein
MKIIERRILKLEYRFGPVDDLPVGEPTTFDLRFVDKDLRVVHQMQITLPPCPNEPFRRGRPWRWHSYHENKRRLASSMPWFINR